MTNRNLVPMLLAATASAAIALAPLTIVSAKSESGIDTLVHAVDSQFHLHHQGVPMMGLISGLAHGFTRGGVRDLHVVTYDNVPQSLDPADLTSLVRTTLQKDWSLTTHSEVMDAEDVDLVTGVHTRVKNDDMVWTQPHGDRIRMLAVTLDGHELSLVQMEMSPAALTRWQNDHAASEAE